MASYKLTYFDLKGRAEPIRLIFTMAGIPFEDKRVAFSDWPALKPTIFNGQLPVLEVDGKVLTESTAIARYVAKQGGLLGCNDFERAKIESVADVVNGLMSYMSQHRYTPDGPIKEHLQKELEEKHLPAVFKTLENFLGNKEFFVLDKITFAELTFYGMFSNLVDCVGCNWKEKTPKLAKLYDRIAQEPKIAAYLAKRK